MIANAREPVREGRPAVRSVLGHAGQSGRGERHEGRRGVSRAAARRRDRLRRRQRARYRQGDRADGRPEPPDLGFRGSRGLVHARERRRHGAGHRRADDCRHRLGSRPRLGHHRRARSHEEDHLPSPHAAGAGDRRSGADRRPAAEHHGRRRHGRAVAQPRSVLRAVLSSDGRRHRRRRHAADQGVAAGRGAGRQEHRGALAHARRVIDGRDGVPEGPRRDAQPEPSVRRESQHASRADQRRGDALRAGVESVRHRRKDAAAGRLPRPARSLRSKACWTGCSSCDEPSAFPTRWPISA